MSENQDKVLAKLTEALNNIGLDIREIKTTLKHFDEKFGRVQKDVSIVREEISDVKHDLEKVKIKSAEQESKTKDNKDDIGRLFEKIKDRDNKIDADRKWIIGIGITVAGIVITLIFNLIGM